MTSDTSTVIQEVEIDDFLDPFLVLKFLMVMAEYYSLCIFSVESLEVKHLGNSPSNTHLCIALSQLCNSIVTACFSYSFDLGNNNLGSNT